MKKPSLLVIFLSVFIDLIGFGIVLPLLPNYAEDNFRPDFSAKGLIIGAMEGYVHYAGNPERFYAFVAGHSALELTGIIICGVAGMLLGQAVLKPGRHTRGAALAVAGKRALPLIYGGALLVFFAAFIEGFWSAGPASPQTKYAVGIANALALTLYLTLCGRKGAREA